MSLEDWLNLLNMIIYSCVHFLANDITSFFLAAKNHIPSCIFVPFSLPISLSFWAPALVLLCGNCEKCCKKNTDVQICLCCIDLESVDKYPDMVELGHLSNLT